MTIVLPEGVPAEALVAGEAKAAAKGKAAGKGKSDRVATPAAAKAPWAGHRIQGRPADVFVTDAWKIRS